MESIKVVDFCGKYRVPMMEYLCQSQCTVAAPSPATSAASVTTNKRGVNAAKMQKVLLSGYDEERGGGSGVGPAGPA